MYERDDYTGLWVLGGAVLLFLGGAYLLPKLTSGTGTKPILPSLPSSSTGVDKFGVKMLHPSVGREWFSKWDNGHARSWVSKGINQRNPDPDDPESDLHANTNGSKCTVDGRGKMIMEGGNPRLYINSPDSNGVTTMNQSPKWTNVEMTIFFKALKADPRGSISVFSRLAARSEHQLESRCGGGGRTMGAFEIKSNGTMQIRREWFHDDYAADVKASMKGPARNVRWGQKFVLRNIGNNAILSEGYISTDGNNWQKVVERLETGPVAPASSDLCKKLPSRESIWIGPATSCYLRCDGNFVEYDSFSIREIAPLPAGAKLQRLISDAHLRRIFYILESR